MIDITIGQMYPSNSIVHRLDARFKIVFTIMFVAMLFISSSPISVALNIVFVIFSYALSKIPFKMLLKTLRPVIPIIVFMTVFNILFYGGETLLLKWWIFKITKEGLVTAGFMILRIILIIAGTSLLTYTTSSMELTDALESLLSPLKKVKLPVHELAMMMTIALRFIPTLIEETQKIMSAQKARGADFESGNILKRARALMPILIPLFISAFRRADELAVAMESRCYHGGEGRTKMKQTKITKRDIIAITAFLIVAALIIIFEIIF